MNDPIIDSLRKEPDKIIVGELRGKELHDFLKATSRPTLNCIVSGHMSSAMSSSPYLNNEQ